MSYMVVGGLGYIGSNLAIKLQSFDKFGNVTVVDCLDNVSEAEYAPTPLSVSSTVELCSMRNELLIAHLMISRKIDNVIISIGREHLADDQWQPAAIYRKILGGLTQLLEVARLYGKLNNLVFISSEEVYGSDSRVPNNECICTRPDTFTGALMCACEHMIHTYSVSYKLPTTVIRLARVVYGAQPGSGMYLERTAQSFEKQGVLAKFSVVHIDDAVDAIVNCIKIGSKGAVYNVGGVSGFTHQTFSELLAAIQNGEEIDSIVSDLSAHIDSAKAIDELNWKVKVPLIDEGKYFLFLLKI